MCRFNIVYARNDDWGILEQNGYMPFDDTNPEYIGYTYGYCNCNSFVGSMVEDKNNFESYEEMTRCMKAERLDTLYKVREMMYQPDYKEKRHKYIEKRDNLIDRIFDMTKDIKDYEIEQMDLLNGKYDCEPPEEEVERLYDEISKREEIVYKTDEYKKLDRELARLRDDNPILEESTMYFLTKEQQDEEMEQEYCEEADDMLAQIFGDIDEVDFDEDEFTEVEFEEPSMVIDDVISQVKGETDKDAKEEFREYQSLFKELLQTNDYILFVTVWEKPDIYNIKKEIPLSKITMEELAKLNYFDIIKIVKD